MQISKPVIGIVALVLLMFGTLLGRFAAPAPKDSVSQHVREESGDYKFISPLLYLTTDESTSPIYLKLKQDIASFADKTIAGGTATDISVYVRDLNTGNWVGYQPDKVYSAASMLKVATLAATLRLAESDPSLLEKKVHILPGFVEPNPQDYFPPKNPLKSGSTYTVNEILNHLIVDSDNTANNALFEIVGRDRIKQTFADLGIPYDETGMLDAIDTAHDYSHLFRVLYNATYLTREDSEKALDLLSRTEFTSGLSAGVPGGTTVSHKFGQRSALPPSNAKELHDCGIVYYPDHPYFICVMTRGSDYDTLAGVIKDASRLVWQDFKSDIAK